MRRAALIAAALLIGFGTMSAQAMLQLIVNFQGAVTYVGPGDLSITGALGWYGARAYSAATRGNKAMNVCNVSDVACADLFTDSSTGNLVVTTIGGSSCSSVTCTVKTLYDQTGNGNDVTNSTIANRPTLVVTCLNGHPCLQYVRASAQVLATAGNISAQNRNFYAAVAIRTGNTTNFHQFMTTGGGELLFNQSANSIGVFAATGVFLGSVADNSWHAMQGQVDLAGGNDSFVSADGTNSSTAVLGSCCSARKISVGQFNGSGGDALDGKLAEAGFWTQASPLYTTTQATTMCHNQFTYWATSTSC